MVTEHLYKEMCCLFFFFQGFSVVCCFSLTNGLPSYVEGQEKIMASDAKLKQQLAQK